MPRLGSSRHARAVGRSPSGGELGVLAAEQAALRRVATLVARGAAPEEVFAALTAEVGRLLPVDYADLRRYEPDGKVTLIAASGASARRSPVGSRWTLGGRNVSTLVARTRRAARIDGYADTSSGPVGAYGRETGIRSAVGSPIIVDGRLWGVMTAASSLEQPLPADTDARLSDFTELLATAIANAESHAALARLAEEQAALRRVATLVARAAPPQEVFAGVVEEVGQLFRVDVAGMARYECGGTISFVATWGATRGLFPIGERLVLGGNNVSTMVCETGRPARLDGYADASGPVGLMARDTGFRSSVATPIIVEGRLWGMMAVATSSEQPLPADVEARLGSFTELVATTIANAESRASLAQLADEQAALRRVATLVARGAPQEQVVAAVVDEVGHLLPVDLVGMGRYGPDRSQTIVASWGGAVERFPVGRRFSLGGRNLVTVIFDTGRPARRDTYADASGPIGVTARETGFRSSVGTPIIVEDHLWGVVIAGSSREQPLPADTEARLAEFTELVGTAIANAESRAALAASRERIVAAADEARRRIERDLHDGIQQRLVSLGLELREARGNVPAHLGELDDELSRVAEGLSIVFEELREISRGIHPAILSEGGLGPALRALARRSPVPVELDLHGERRLPESVVVGAYYIVSEAVTNAVKHAHASVVNVELDAPDAIARLAIRDDGIGGADPGHGSGLIGLRDRIDALGGTLEITSPPGDGTALSIEIPLAGRAA
jgi:signal transduction histidine kinase